MAERNFDEEFAELHGEGHSFTLGGYTFHTPAVAPPGAFLAGGRGLLLAVNFLRRVVLPEERADLERVLEMPDITGSLIDMAPDLLRAVMDFLVADELSTAKDTERRDKALATLREVAGKADAAMKAPEKGPDVSAVQVDEVADWLMEVTIGRPTKPPSPSGNGAGRTSSGSKATSRKPAKAGRN